MDLSRILIVTQHFWPENFKINDLAVELRDKGFDVTVLTGKPNYPSGSFFEGYSFFGKPVEFYNGIKVYRVPLFRRGSGGGWRLFVNYVSFVVFASLFICFHWRPYDYSLVFASSPVTQAYPALLHKLLFRTRVIVWLLDLWPESVESAGGLRNRFIISLIRKLSNHIYRKSDKIMVQSEAFIPVLKERGVPGDRLYYVPNWAEEIFEKGEYEQPDIDPFTGGSKNDFTIMFAGNMGEAQGIEHVIEAAYLTRHNPIIKWVFLGGGRNESYAIEKVKELNLTDTVRFYGRHHQTTMPWFYEKADIMLISLKDEYTFSLTIPARLQSFMAVGKPVLGFINGECAELIKKADCGFTSVAEDSIKLAELVTEISRLSSEELLAKGLNGQDFYRRNFMRSLIIDRVISILSS